MVLIECPSQNVMMFKNQLFNASQVVGPHSPVASQADSRHQPELAESLEDVSNDKPSKSHAIRLPGNKPAAWRMAAGILVVPLFVNTVSIAFTVRIIPPLFLLAYSFRAHTSATHY
jgi:hypothetical protein